MSILGHNKTALSVRYIQLVIVFTTMTVSVKLSEPPSIRICPYLYGFDYCFTVIRISFQKYGNGCTAENYLNSPDRHNLEALNYCLSNIQQKHYNFIGKPLNSYVLTCMYMYAEITGIQHYCTSSSCSYYFYCIHMLTITISEEHTQTG